MYIICVYSNTITAELRLHGITVTKISILWSPAEEVCQSLAHIILLLLLLLSRFSRVRLCATDPIDSSPPGSPVPGILQARTLEWAAISFSNAWKWKVKVKLLSRLQLLATPWTAAHQGPPSMGFSRQEYWSGVPLPSPPYNTRHLKFLETCFMVLCILNFCKYSKYTWEGCECRVPFLSKIYALNFSYSYRN